MDNGSKTNARATASPPTLITASTKVTLQITLDTAWASSLTRTRAYTRVVGLTTKRWVREFTGGPMEAVSKEFGKAECLSKGS